MDRIKLGSRGSRLALWQADWVKRQIEAHFPEITTEIVVIRTESDRQQEVPLAAMSSRGVFTRDIENALLEGRIDAAVHSLKDLPTDMPDELCIAAASPREDPRDVLIRERANGLDSLAIGAIVGTSSMRRSALMHAARPDADIRPLRGNIDTRLRKLRNGEYDAILMAAAALNRLDMDLQVHPLDPDVWVPAVAQGIIGVQARRSDEKLLALLGGISDEASMLRASTERAFLHALGGGCTVPVGGHAVLESDTIRLRGFVGSPDGARTAYAENSASTRDSDELAQRVADELIAKGAQPILDKCRAGLPAGDSGV